MPRPWSEQRKKRLSALQAAGRGADEIATALGLRREQVVARLKLIASWERFRVPVALALIDPTCRGHQNILFRQMLKDFVPPAWVQQVVVVADAGFAANATLRLITEKCYTYVFAMPRTRNFTNGKHLRDLVQHLPKSCYHRRASHNPGAGDLDLYDASL